MWILDPKTKEPSASLSVWIYSTVLAGLKLAVSGVVIGSFSFGVFDASQFALVIGAAGALYLGRKGTDAFAPPKDKQ